MISFDWTGSRGVVAGGPKGWLDPVTDKDAIDLLYRPSRFRFEPGGDFPGGSFVFTGDNLPVLASLREVYHGRIRLIYIDPPYNTGRNVFGYPDRFEPEVWLTFMKNRLELARDLLAPDGSIFLHLDHNAGHYGRLLLDAVFGPERFINEIIWCYHGPGTPKQKRFSRKHDTILWYAAGENWKFNRDEVRLPSNIHAGGFNNELDGKLGKSYMTKGKIPEDWWNIAVAARFRVDGLKRTGYQTEKPLKLLERIIKTASDEGDLILDFFAGSGITGFAAAGLKRRFILVEQRPEAVAHCTGRLSGHPLTRAELADAGGYLPDVDPDNDRFYLRNGS
jgi:adenine-specific DNA-methyltransferase